MATSMKRFMLTVAPEMERTLDELKQKMFYNKSYSEMYRYILEVGMSAIKSSDFERQEETQEDNGNTR